MRQPASGRGAFRNAAGTLRRYGRAHRRWLGIGLAGTLGVVFARLAIPWPLRWALELARGEGSSPLGGAEGSILPIAAGYVAIAVVLGLSELVQRTNLGRYTTLLSHDLREAAARGASRAGLRQGAELGDVTSRIVGDSARLKSDLTGILVHASTNGLLFLAVSGVMLWISPGLGSIFLVSGAAVVAYGASTSSAVAVHSGRQRAKEGRYAGELHAGLAGGEDVFLELARVNDASGRRGMRAAGLVARSSLVVHVFLGGAVALGLWLSVAEIRAGLMAPGELFLFVAYALTVHRRMVQVGRQTARSGKVVACVERLLAVVDADEREVGPSALRGELVRELRLEGVRIPLRRGRRARLRGIDLAIAPGERVAVVGAAGDGKTTLLRLLAGREPVWRGSLRWDGELVEPPGEALASGVAYLGEALAFPRRPLWRVLGLPAAGPPPPDVEQTLRAVGAWRVLRAFRKPERWTARVGSLELTRGEARALALARLLLVDGPRVWLLDGPIEGLARRQARRRLAEILRRAEGRTLVASFTRARDLDGFDRLVVLRGGRIVFDGTPAGWSGRAERATSVPAAAGGSGR